MDRELFEKRKKLICELIQDDLYVPMKEKELAAFMQVSKADREEFRKVLDALLAEGKIQLSAKGKYSKPDERFLTGTFIGNARGFGFVEIEGREEDLYIPKPWSTMHFIWTKYRWNCCPESAAKGRKPSYAKYWSMVRNRSSVLLSRRRHLVS